MTNSTKKMLAILNCNRSVCEVEKNTARRDNEEVEKRKVNAVQI